MEPRRSWTAPSGQGFTFVELFFDLVFVFAVTGMARFALHDPTLLGGARALLVFWMVWWAWTQLTWALNGAGGLVPGHPNASQYKCRSL